MELLQSNARANVPTALVGGDIWHRCAPNVPSPPIQCAAPPPWASADRATTRNWSICRSVRGLSGSHTFISIFCWFRLSDSPGEGGGGDVGVQLTPPPTAHGPPNTTQLPPPLSPHLLPAGLGSLLGICSPPGSPPDRPKAFSGRGRTPTSRRSSPGGGGESRGGAKKVFSWVPGGHRTPLPTIKTCGAQPSPPFPSTAPGYRSH